MDCYYLHFAIPMAWLGGVAVKELFSVLWRCEFSQFRKPPFKPVCALLLWSALVSLVVVGTPEKLQRGFASISFAENARENPVVRQMKEYRESTTWVFTDRVIYAFHAGLLVPPELAVIPSKRIWSQQINPSQIVSQLRRYQPEQIILFGSLKQEKVLIEYLEANYAPSPNADRKGSYLLKTVLAEPRGNGAG